MAEQMPTSLADKYPAQKRLADLDLAEAERRYDVFLESWKKSQDKLYIGGIVLNSASATALFTALQTGETALQKLQISTEMMADSLGMFVAGVIAAAVAHWTNHIIIGRWAADHYSDRLAPLRNQVAQFAQPASNENFNALRNFAKNVAQPQDFRFSHIQIILANLSGCLWLGGIGNITWPLWSVSFSNLFR